MAVIGEAFIEVRPTTDARKFQADAERGFLGPLKGIATKAAGIMAAAFAGAQVGQFFTSAVQGASSLSESLSKNRVVFGAAADEVLRFAEGSAAAFGQSQAQALEATGVFGNLLRAVGLSEDQSAKFSVTMTQLASDLASFNNTSVDEALTALRSGLVGETEPLKRFGVNLNEATLQQKAMELGLISSKTQLDANQRAQAAYALIMEQTALAQGDFARTSGGLANQQKILAAQWTDLKTRLGTALLPTVTGFVRFLNTSLIPGVERAARVLGDVFGPVFTVIGRIIQFQVRVWVAEWRFVLGVLGALIDGISDFARAFAEGFRGLTAGTVTSGVLGFATRLGDAFRTVFDGIREGARQMVGTINDALAGAEGAIERSGIGQVFSGLQPALTDAANFVGQFIVVLTRDLGGAIQGGIDSWRLYRTDGIGPVAEALAGLETTIGNVTRVLAEQRDVLIPAAASAATFAGAFVTYRQVSTGISAVSSALSLLGPALGTAFAPLLANPVGLIVAAVLALAAAFAAAYFHVKPFREAVDAVARVVADVAVQAFEGAQVAVARLGEVFSGVGRVIAGAFSGVGRALGGVASAVIGALSPIVTWVSDNLGATFLAAVDFIDALMDRLRDVFGPPIRIIIAQLRLLAGVVRDALGAAFKIVGPIITTVVRVIGVVLTTFARVVVPIFAGAFAGIAAVVETAFGVVRGVIESTLQTIRGIFTLFAGILRGDFGRIFEGLTDIVTAPLTLLQRIVEGLLGGVVDFVASLPGRIADVATGMFDGMVELVRTGIEGFSNFVSGVVDGVVGFFSGLPRRINEFIDDVGVAALGLGGAIIQKILEGLRGAGAAVGELAADVAGAIADVGKGLLNGVIQAINDLLPNEIGRIESPSIPGVGRITIFPGINLPDDPIPLLAGGGLVRAVPGGVLARIGEGSRDEAVLPLPPGVIEGLQAIARARGQQPGRSGDTNVFNIYEAASARRTAMEATAVLRARNYVSGR